MLSDDELPPPPDYLSPGTVREYARAVERAAYERAAQECDEWAKHCQATIGGPLGDYREGKADAASTLAERIRALGRQHD